MTSELQTEENKTQEWEETCIEQETEKPIKMTPENELLRKVSAILKDCIESSNISENEMLGNVSAALKEYERKNYSNKILEDLRYSARNGVYPLKSPIGYFDILEPNGDYRLERSSDSIYISQAFELYANGMSVPEILEELKIEDLSPYILEEILQNPIYVGYFEFEGRIYCGNHEAIISKELFDKVQDRLIQEKEGK